MVFLRVPWMPIVSSSGTIPLSDSARMIFTPTQPPSEPTRYWMGLGTFPGPPIPTGASIGKVIPDDVRVVKAPSPLYVTVMSTGFHSIRDLSQGISALMLTGCPCCIRNHAGRERLFSSIYCPIFLIIFKNRSAVLLATCRADYCDKFFRHSSCRVAPLFKSIDMPCENPAPSDSPVPQRGLC